MKQMLSILIVTLFISCQKDYKCVCKSAYSNQDSIVGHVKTTKLGSKGYKKTCSSHEKATLSNCRLE